MSSTSIHIISVNDEEKWRDQGGCAGPLSLTLSPPSPLHQNDNIGYGSQKLNAFYYIMEQLKFNRTLNNQCQEYEYTL